jgi:hypothetical protein
MLTQLSVRHHAVDAFHVSCRHIDNTAQCTFVLGGFLGKDVAFERLTPLHGTASADYQALGSAFLGLHLRHNALSDVASLGGS